VYWLFNDITELKLCNITGKDTLGVGKDVKLKVRWQLKGIFSVKGLKKEIVALTGVKMRNDRQRNTEESVFGRNKHLNHIHEL
jgi:hypothetical protein